MPQNKPAMMSSDAIANHIVTVWAANKDVTHSVPPSMVLHALAYRIAAQLAEGNDQFDGDRFLKLCGISG